MKDGEKDLVRTVAGVMLIIIFILVMLAMLAPQQEKESKPLDIGWIE